MAFVFVGSSYDWSSLRACVCALSGGAVVCEFWEVSPPWRPRALHCGRPRLKPPGWCVVANPIPSPVTRTSTPRAFREQATDKTGRDPADLFTAQETTFPGVIQTPHIDLRRGFV
ncbi:unnamed protein product [Lampetra planeri]